MCRRKRYYDITLSRQKGASLRKWTENVLFWHLAAQSSTLTCVAKTPNNFLFTTCTPSHSSRTFYVSDCRLAKKVVISQTKLQLLIDALSRSKISYSSISSFLARNFPRAKPLSEKLEFSAFNQNMSMLFVTDAHFIKMTNFTLMRRDSCLNH